MIAAPCGVDPIVFAAPAAGVLGVLVWGVGLVLGAGVVTTGGTVFTVMLTDASPVLALPAASVKAPAATETTPSVVLLAVGVL